MPFAKWAAAISLSLFLASTPALANLVITPSFDPSVPAALQTVINNAINAYQGLYTDPIAVTILFRYAATVPKGDGTFIPFGSGGLAQSNSTVYSLPWATFISDLKKDSKTSNDSQAVSSLPATSLSTNINPSSANGRAVGENTPGAMNTSGVVGSGGTLDGIVSLNSGQSFQFDRTGGPQAGQYDATRVVEHEVDEILGLGSSLPSGSNYRPEDLFRYSSAHTRQTPLDSSITATSFFSINDGVTNIIGFNQNAGKTTSSGDYGDWLSDSGCPAFVQDAFSCSGQFANVMATSPEGVALDVIGYDLAAPEPTSTILMFSGLILLAATLRRAKRRSNTSGRAETTLDGHPINRHSFAFVAREISSGN